ncbi:MAG: hypothetical protein J5510_05175 [Prevotella sp.]|nr:hypothetical protein [Prevotella sp.]
MLPQAIEVQSEMVAEDFKQRETAQNPPRAAVVAQDPEAIKKHFKNKKRNGKSQVSREENPSD